MSNPEQIQENISESVKDKPEELKPIPEVADWALLGNADKNADKIKSGDSRMSLQLQWLYRKNTEFEKQIVKTQETQGGSDAEKINRAVELRTKHLLELKEAGHNIALVAKLDEESRRAFVDQLAASIEAERNKLEELKQMAKPVIVEKTVSETEPDTQEIPYDALQNIESEQNSFRLSIAEADEQVELHEKAARKMMTTPLESELKRKARITLSYLLREKISESVLQHGRYLAFLATKQELSEEQRIVERAGKKEVLSFEDEISNESKKIESLHSLDRWAGTLPEILKNSEILPEAEPVPEIDKDIKKETTREKKSISIFSGAMNKLKGFMWKIFAREPELERTEEIPAPQPQVRYESQSSIRNETKENSTEEKFRDLLKNPTIENLASAQEILSRESELEEDVQKKLQLEIDYQAAATLNELIQAGLKTIETEKGLEDFETKLGPLLRLESLGSRRTKKQVQSLVAKLLDLTASDSKTAKPIRNLINKYLSGLAGF